jgi:hypothetical protein
MTQVTSEDTNTPIQRLDVDLDFYTKRGFEIIGQTE